MGRRAPDHAHPLMPAAWPEGPSRVVLPDHDVHVWRAALAAGPMAVDTLEATLAEDERARADRYRARRDRDHFVVARGVLRAILARYLATRPADVRFAYGRRGKPVIEGAMNAGGLRFNLSHSGDVALVGVTRDREVGVDVESLRPREEDVLAERFFSRRETAALRALSPRERRAAFYACWTRKEAYVKAKGEGLAIALDQFSVTVAPDQAAALLHVEGDSLEAGRWALADLDVGDDYAAALCVEGRPGVITCWQWP